MQVLFKGQIKSMEDKQLVSGDNSLRLMLESSFVTVAQLKEIIEIKRDGKNASSDLHILIATDLNQEQ